MALPSSGELKISDIASEFGDTAPHSMSEFYRGGGLVPDSSGNSAVPTSGQIGIGNFYNAANRASIPLVISSNTQNYDVYSNRGPSYIAGNSDITVTINPGVFVGSSTTPTYALSVPGSFTSGDTVRIVNNGVIIGRGGNGGPGAHSSAQIYNGAAGGTGGRAVYVNFPTTIDNNGTMAGGGGGGGGGAADGIVTPRPPKTGGPYSTYYGGGGGGGGAGYPGGSGGSGGSGLLPVASPGNPGSSGTTSSGGSGGGAPGAGGPGGAGGGRGANGSAGTNAPRGNPGPGGTRGYYLVGSPFVTYESTGTRSGLVS